MKFDEMTDTPLRLLHFIFSLIACLLVTFVGLRLGTLFFCFPITCLIELSFFYSSLLRGFGDCFLLLCGLVGGYF